MGKNCGPLIIRDEQDYMIFSVGIGMYLPSGNMRRGILFRGVVVIRNLIRSTYICLLLCIPGMADSIADNTTQPGYEYHNIQGYMNHLFRLGEYSRARNELYRIKSLYPGRVSEIQCNITETHFLYVEVLKKRGESPFLGLYTFDSLAALGRLAESEKVIHEDFGNITEPLREMLKRRQIMAELLNDRTVTVPASETGMQTDDVRRIIEYTRVERLNRKNPWTGAGLSVIPGCGYIYADQMLTGVVAGIVISGLSVLTYYAFHTGNSPAGVVLGAAAVFFYGGNIIGGYRDTLRYNSAIDEKCRGYLDAKLNLERDRRRIVSSFGLVTDDDSR